MPSSQAAVALSRLRRSGQSCSMAGAPGSIAPSAVSIAAGLPKGLGTPRPCITQEAHSSGRKPRLQGLIPRHSSVPRGQENVALWWVKTQAIPRRLASLSQRTETAGLMA